MTATEPTLPIATVHGLYHIAIKTENLAATRKFYIEIIGLREFPRPDFGYPGAWLGCPQPGGLAIMHIYAGGPALGPEGKAPAGTAAIDHVSLSCSGYRSFVSRFKAAGLDWREFIVPGTTLWQLFVDDPSGVQLELTFECGGRARKSLICRRAAKMLPAQASSTRRPIPSSPDLSNRRSTPAGLCGTGQTSVLGAVEWWIRTARDPQRAWPLQASVRSARAW